MAYEYICDHCAEAFTNKCKLMRHIRTHTVTKPSREIARNKRISCCFCDEKFSAYSHYEKHLVSHNVSLEKEELSFKNDHEFKNWQESLNKTGQHYSKDSCTKKIKNGYVDYFRCHRSYNANVTKGKRIKHTGSVKIGHACVSQMKVIHRDEGNVLVYFTKTHIGHDCDIRKVPLLQSDKLKIVEKMNEGVPFKRILNDIRAVDTPCSDDMNKIERIHLVNRKALYDISKEFNVNRSIQKDQNNEDSVEIWFEEMISTGEEPEPAIISTAPASVPEIDQLMDVDDENVNNEKTKSDDFTFSSVIKSKILEIYNMKSYPKENENDIDNLLNELISKMNSRPYSNQSNLEDTKPKKLINQKSTFQSTVKRKAKHS